MRAYAWTLGLLVAAIVLVNATATWIQAGRDVAVCAMAAQLRPGFVVADYRNVDERCFQMTRLAVIPAPRMVAFGSSRIMQLTSAAAGLGPGEFYNVGMSGATIEDFVAMWRGLERSNKIPPVVVIAIDPWTLGARQTHLRWMRLAEQVEDYLPLGPVQHATYHWYRLKELVSFAVLRETMGGLRRWAREQASGEGSRGPVITTEADRTGRQTVRADGSLLYERTYVLRPLDERRRAAVRYATRLAGDLREFRWSDERAALLVRLWGEMRQRGSTVLVFVAPYHPMAWRLLREHLDPDQPMGIGVRSLRDSARRLGVLFEDVSDPDRIPCPEAEFLDGDHATAECLGRVVARLVLHRPDPRN